jgi:hypothetical protein
VDLVNRPVIHHHHAVFDLDIGDGECQWLPLIALMSSSLHEIREIIGAVFKPYNPDGRVCQLHFSNHGCHFEQGGPFHIHHKRPEGNERTRALVVFDGHALDLENESVRVELDLVDVYASVEHLCKLSGQQRMKDRRQYDETRPPCK